jgi:putative ATP-binding cassette transporter
MACGTPVVATEIWSTPEVVRPGVGVLVTDRTGGAIATGMAQYYFAQMLIMRWREWMTRHYLDIWMAQGRHYRIRLLDESIDNIHLRIASDILLFIQRTQELGSNLLSSIVSLGSFAYILWGISAIAPLPLFGFDFSFPGYLILGAVSYAALGMVFAHFIGHKLIPLNFMQQRREADFRFAIARVTDHAEAVALMRGEPVERGELKTRFAALVRNWTNLIFRQNRLNGFVFGYYHISTVLPTLLVTPAYMIGAIPLGILMQAASALAFCTNTPRSPSGRLSRPRRVFDAGCADSMTAICASVIDRETSAGAISR